MEVSLYFAGEPKAIQSVRVAQIGGFIRKYQPKANVDWKAYLRVLAIDQLPTDWEPLSDALELHVDFSFAPLRSMSKKLRARIAGGEIVYKPSRPDLCDNLMKGLCDALTGVVWRDDAQICRVSSVKRYGDKPGIAITVTPL